MNNQIIDKKNNLVWIDLEMTGLDVSVDTIIEIALIITDSQLNIVQEGPAFVIHQPDSVIAAMDPWCQVQHNKSGLVNAMKQSTVTMAQAEQQILHIIQMYCTPKTGVLAGNSVWQDRVFLARYMPKIVEYMHYRLVDVSSVKELLKRWYPENPALLFKKKDSHRALTDIQESIEELKHYRKNFFIPLP